MRLLYPDTLWYLLGLLPLLLLSSVWYRRSRRNLETLTGFWRRTKVYNVFLVKSFFSTLLLTLFFVFAILAASGFTWGRETVEDDRSGVDIVFAVDVSRSMLAQDIPPSRLARARDAMRGALRELEFSRFSIVVFKGEGITAVPMTEDSVAIDNFLSALSVQIMTSPGTNIAAGITEALDAFPAAVNRHRIVVLFTDGESVGGGDLDSAIAGAARQEVPVFVVAAGSEAGARIPLGDDDFVTDENGEAVIARVNPSSLRAIADETGGSYISLAESGSISSLLGTLNDFYGRVSVDGLRTISVERYQTFLGAALLFLFLYILLGALRWRNLF